MGNGKWSCVIAVSQRERHHDVAELTAIHIAHKQHFLSPQTRIHMDVFVFAFQPGSHSSPAQALSHCPVDSHRAP